MGESLLSELEDPESRKALRETVLALFDRWNLGERDRAVLLGLSEKPDGTADEVLLTDRQSMERIGQLLAIGRALDAKFRDQPELCDRWIATYPVKLRGVRPLDVMLTDGLTGMEKVRSLLQGEPRSRDAPQSRS
jgi:hypothetical protein